MGSTMSDSGSTLLDAKTLAPGDEQGPKIHPSPGFRHPTSDVVLRSSDGVDFHVHKLILSLTSPFFETMFTLPIPKCPSSTDPIIEGQGELSVNGIQVVAMAETSATLEMLLAFCYPGMTNPSLVSANLSQLKALANAVEKFGMDVLADTIENALIAFAGQSSVAVYAAGCQLRRPRVIEAAARRTLEEPFMAAWSAELSAITGEQYYCLLDYHRQCSEAAGKLALSNWKWIGSVANIPLAGPSQECPCTMLVTYNTRLEGSILNSPTTTAKNTFMFYVPGWWCDYMKGAEAALKKTPCSVVITGDELLGPALTKSIDCNNKSCRTGAREAMVSFSQRFAQQVDKVINEIPLPNRCWH